MCKRNGYRSNIVRDLGAVVGDRKETHASLNARFFENNPALPEELNINTTLLIKFPNQNIPFQSGSFNKASQGSCRRK